jgi:hypothetical protein
MFFFPKETKQQLLYGYSNLLQSTPLGKRLQLKETKTDAAGQRMLKATIRLSNF